MTRELDGQPLALDPDAESADENLPAFLARPPGAPVYHGFPILDDVEVDGFRLGIITSIGGDDAVVGDAFVVAPDNSRCGLVWVAPESTDYELDLFEPMFPIESQRWGVWVVGVPEPMRDHAAARRNLASILPRLREQWERWLIEFGQTGVQP